MGACGSGRSAGLWAAWAPLVKHPSARDCWRLVRFVGDSQTVVVRKPAGNFTRHHMPMADGQEDMAFGHSYAGMLLAFYQLPDARQGIRADDGIGIALEDDSGDPSAVKPGHWE